MAKAEEKNRTNHYCKSCIVRYSPKKGEIGQSVAM